MSVLGRGSTPWWVPVAVLVLTEAQLGVAEFSTGIARFEGKAFGARLIAYPVLMLIVPVVWWLRARRSGSLSMQRAPYGAFALIMAPFLIDVAGNSLNLYDTISWWDDANHFVNWALLNLGIGLLIVGGLPRAWQRILMVTGIGAILALCWEIGEWYTFIRHGTELAGAYEDTLSDMTLGTCGALCAGVLVAWRSRRDARERRVD